MGLNSSTETSELDGHYLLFENHFGDGDLVSAKELFELVRNAGRTSIKP